MAAKLPCDILSAVTVAKFQWRSLCMFNVYVVLALVSLHVVLLNLSVYLTADQLQPVNYTLK